MQVRGFKRLQVLKIYKHERTSRDFLVPGRRPLNRTSLPAFQRLQVAHRSVKATAAVE